MDKCGICGRQIRFIRRAGTKALVVEMSPIHFVPGLSGDMYFIYDGVMRRGSISNDGLKGYILHNCEVR